LNTPLESATRDQIAAAIAEIIRRCCRNCREQAVIDQAKGMLILLDGMDDPTAFDTLRRHSQNTKTSNCEPSPNSWCLTTAPSATEKRTPVPRGVRQNADAVHDRITRDPN
jgi:hypothetical protein